MWTSLCCCGLCDTPEKSEHDGKSYNTKIVTEATATTDKHEVKTAADVASLPITKAAKVDEATCHTTDQEHPTTESESSLVEKQMTAKAEVEVCDKDGEAEMGKQNVIETEEAGHYIVEDKGESAVEPHETQQRAEEVEDQGGDNDVEAPKNGSAPRDDEEQAANDECLPHDAIGYVNATEAEVEKEGPVANEECVPHVAMENEYTTEADVEEATEAEVGSPANEEEAGEDKVAANENAGGAEEVDAGRDEVEVEKDNRDFKETTANTEVGSPSDVKEESVTIEGSGNVESEETNEVNEGEADATETTARSVDDDETKNNESAPREFGN